MTARPLPFVHVLRVAAVLASFAAAPAARAQAPLADSLRTRIDAVFSRFDHTDTPGCAVGISQSGRTIYERGFGMAELQYALAITPQSIFHVASVSKQFTAFAVALLAQDGKLSLDDDIRKHVPELPDYGTVITVRQLMHHVSGLRDQWQLLGYAGWRFPEDLITENDVMGIVKRQRGLNFAPQTEYLYSNTGFTLLAVIVKRVSGQSLREFAQARIFAPLGMTHTHFHDDHSMIVPNRTSAYEPRGAGWRISIPDFDTYGATSLFTTTGDLLKWMRNLDEPVVGTPALVAQAQTSAVLRDGTPTNYGFGLTVNKYRGLQAVGHAGADAGYRAYVERFPERGLAIAVLCNASNSGPNLLARRAVDVLLGSAVPAEPTVVDPAPVAVADSLLARWVGVYHDSVSHNVVRIQNSGGTLRSSSGGRLIPTSDTTMRIAGTSNSLVLRVEGGKVTGVRQVPRGLRELVYRREAPLAPSRDLLQPYAGTYYSEELDVRYALVAMDSVLQVDFRKLNNATMAPVFADGFLANFGATIIFTRDAKHRITGFTLSDGRVRNVRFQREGAIK